MGIRFGQWVASRIIPVGMALAFFLAFITQFLTFVEWLPYVTGLIAAVLAMIFSPAIPEATREKGDGQFLAVTSWFIGGIFLAFAGFEEPFWANPLMVGLVGVWYYYLRTEERPEA